LGSERSIIRHEVVTAQPAKEMLATGEWWVARVGGLPYMVKPPLSSWLIAGSMVLFQSESEFVVRLPSVCCALLTAVLVAMLAARWFGSNIGLLAGLMQTTSYHVLQISRLAEQDMPFVAGVCAAMVCFAFANLDSPRGRARGWHLPLCFYLAVAASFLAKGPLGPFFVLAGCGLFILIYRQRQAIWFLLSPLGLAAFLGCVMGYMLLAYTSYPPVIDAFLLHNLGRFQGELGTNQHALSYFYHFPLVMLPWFPFLVWAFVQAWREGALRRPMWGFALCWLLPGFVVLNLSAFKSKHYLAPLLPPFVVFSAVGLKQFLAWHEANAGRWRRWLLGATAIGCAGAIAAVLIARPPAAGPIACLIGLLGVGLVVLIFVERRPQRGVRLAGTFALVWLVVAGSFAFVMPHHDSYRDQTILAGRVNAIVPPQEILWIVKLTDNQITYYLRQPLRCVEGEERFLRERGVQPKPVYVLGPEWLGEWLANAGQVRVLDRCDSVVKWLKPNERLTLMEWTPSRPAIQATAGLGKDRE